MNKNLTELVLIIDRSGSMASTKKDAEGGINNLILNQKKSPGQCNLTLCQFDFELETVFENQPLNTITLQYSLSPRGSTALLDAIGKVVNRVGVRLANTKEEDRPGLVYVCVVTDGQENSSMEFNKKQIRELIAQQTNKYLWKFDFLGAGDSFLQGNDLGFESAQTYDQTKTFSMYNSVSSKLGRMRGQTAQGLSVSNTYTEEEKRNMQ